MDVKEQSYSSKLSEKKYNSRLETASDDEMQSMHKKHVPYFIAQDFGTDSYSSAGHSRRG